MTRAGIDAAPNEGAAGPRSFATVLIGRSRLLQEGLARILEKTDFQIVASAASVEQLDLIDVQQQQAVLLIVDDTHEAEIAIREMQLFKQAYPASRIAVLTQTDRMTDIASLFQAGANVCFPKTVPPAIFLKSLELVMLGETILPPTVLSLILQSPNDGTAGDGGRNKELALEVESKYTPRLSEREEGILRCLIEGDSNKVIARKSNIAEATVKVHVKAVLRKIGVRNRTQAAMWAMRNEALIGSGREASLLG